MSEYEEILLRIGGDGAWDGLKRLIDLLHARTDTIILAAPTFHWHLITVCPDDDKFADAAVCKDAQWIVTEDHHFDVLNDSSLITARPIHPRKFIEDYCQEV